MYTAGSDFNRNEIWPLDRKVFLRNKLRQILHLWRRKTIYFFKESNNQVRKGSKDRERSSKLFNYYTDGVEDDDNEHRCYWAKFNYKFT